MAPISNEIGFHVDLLISTSSWKEKRNKVVADVKFNTIKAFQLLQFSFKQATDKWGLKQMKGCETVSLNS